MSYFNSEQESYMRSLSSIPPERRCWCGWERIGECYHCNRTHPDQTCADKMRFAAGAPTPGRGQDAAAEKGDHK